MSWQRSLRFRGPLTGKRDKVGHGEVTINNARIIAKINAYMYIYFFSYFQSKHRLWILTGVAEQHINGSSINWSLPATTCIFLCIHKLSIHHLSETTFFAKSHFSETCKEKYDKVILLQVLKSAIKFIKLVH